jgi:glutamate/tyrosine decarboxylase-like PLP-dependent enzyme
VTPSPDRATWEWPVDEIRRVGYRVVDLIAEHLAGLPGRPVFQPFPPELARRYLESVPPAVGMDADAILDRFAADVAAFPFGNGHPRFFGWVNSPPVVIGIFAEALAAAMNPSCAGGNHAAIYVERQVIDWFKQIVGFPAEGMGLLVSGGSMAALTGLAVARHARAGVDVRAAGLRSTPQRLCVYQTREAHGCHQKAVELLGLGSDSVRTVRHDRAFRMDPAALESRIRLDVDAGDRPLAVIATAGTVNTGAIDPIGDVADICSRYGVWLHVDGAYGAPAILSPAYATLLRDLSRADSVAIDPHKWLYVPVEAGLVLVRDRELMRATFSLVPAYLRTDGLDEGVAGPPWFSEYGLQQTRSFPALTVWMALQYHGLAGYRAAIEHDLALAADLADSLRRASDFDVLEPQSLGIVCFRYRPPERVTDAAAVDTLNKAALERLQLSGTVFLSSTIIDDRFWLRACIVNPRSTRADVHSIVDAVRASARAVSRERAS